MYIITCKICGVEFEAPNKAIEYCADCKAAHSIGFNKPKPRKRVLRVGESHAERKTRPIVNAM